ncbi:MAG: methionine--tRNA ligase [Candidatus Eisenbacteria bacterium]|uniref:Methionine--tRNA ligase n=1 Tax=Eiseniibacteriota bacterium TaxID=2212470 RepID=A0A933SDA0_UNCEI|nr:methionine--tRNA ligase [Candidatus Eisenbacteria bacterium]
MSRFYITTAIDYVNGQPHLGHAYEKVLADAVARWHRQQGHATYFLTGTDEHGQKIARSAAAVGKDPQAYVDEISKTFVKAWDVLDVKYDQFFRTTDKRHELAVQELFRRLQDALSPKTGEPVLYEESYEGLYCEGCEGFKTEKDLDEEGRCPEHKVKPKEVKETNFFFRLSEYDEALLKHIEAHPDFIQPDYRRNEVVNVIKSGLQDVSVTRPNVPWGVALPEEIPNSEGHTVYVWADALLNYLSALGWPERRYSLWWLAKEKETGGPGAARQDEFQHLDGQGKPGAAWAGTRDAYFTNAFHLIGKDISRFHCVLWPALLLAAGVPLPRQVYIHGFIYARGGDKMGKSLGNAVDPVEMAKLFGADALRFYLLDSFPTGRDGEFTIEQFVEHCNAHLANKLGNLVSRSVTLVHKYFDGKSPAEWDVESFADPAAGEALKAVIAAAEKAATDVPSAWSGMRLNEALDSLWDMIERANEFTDRAEPWKSGKDPARRTELGTTLSALLEVLRLAAIWGWPAMPAKCEAMWATLGHEGSPGTQHGEAAQPRFGASEPRPLGPSQILFPRIDLKSVAGA